MPTTTKTVITKGYKIRVTVSENPVRCGKIIRRFNGSCCPTKKKPCCKKTNQCKSCNLR